MILEDMAVLATLSRVSLPNLSTLMARFSSTNLHACAHCGAVKELVALGFRVYIAVKKPIGQILLHELAPACANRVAVKELVALLHTLACVCSRNCCQEADGQVLLHKLAGLCMMACCSGARGQGSLHSLACLCRGREALEACSGGRHANP